jgi:hypothetical protein
LFDEESSLLVVFIDGFGLDGIGRVRNNCCLVKLRGSVKEAPVKAGLGAMGCLRRSSILFFFTTRHQAPLETKPKPLY